MEEPTDPLSIGIRHRHSLRRSQVQSPEAVSIDEILHGSSPQAHSAQVLLDTHTDERSLSVL